MVGTSNDPAYIDVCTCAYMDRPGEKKNENCFNFCSPRATTPKKRAAMDMAAKQAKAVADKAEKA